MLENRVPLKLKNNVTSFSEIVWSKLNWATYSVFVETVTARTMPGSIVMTYTYLVHTRMQALKPNKQMPALTPNKQPYLHFFSSRSLFLGIGGTSTGDPVCVCVCLCVLQNVLKIFKKNQRNLYLAPGWHQVLLYKWSKRVACVNGGSGYTCSEC